MKSRVAPTPIGMVLIAGWPNVRCSHCAVWRGDFRIEHDVEIGIAEPGEVGGRGAERRDDIHVDAEATQQAGDFLHVVAMAKAERGRAEQIAAWPRPGWAGRPWRARRRRVRSRESAHEMIEGLRRAPVFLALIGGQLERHDRDRQIERARQTARIVLDQLGRAGRADQHRLRLEALVGIARGALEQLRGVAAEIARLERRVGDRRTLRVALDHREQQIGVGVALRRVQHVMHAVHRGRDPHRADVGRAFVCPERELHRLGHQPGPAHERPREQLGEIGGLLVALDRREHQFDRPFGRQAFGLERIGETEAAHHEIGPRGAAAIELPLDVLAFAQQGAGRQQRAVRRRDAARCR